MCRPARAQRAQYGDGFTDLTAALPPPKATETVAFFIAATLRHMVKRLTASDNTRLTILQPRCQVQLIMILSRIALSLTGAVLFPLAAHAHVTLEQGSAEAGKSYKAVLRIPHGCDGSATTGIQVTLPDGVRQAKPMPHAGWSVQVVKEKLAQPYDWHGDTITEDVRRIRWQGGNLPDAYYDEFVFRIQLPPDAGKTLYFKVKQRCEKGEIDWAAVPGDSSGNDYPAASLKLLPPASSSH